MCLRPNNAACDPSLWRHGWLAALGLFLRLPAHTESRVQLQRHRGSHPVSSAMTCCPVPLIHVPGSSRSVDRFQRAFVFLDCFVRKHRSCFRLFGSRPGCQRQEQHVCANDCCLFLSSWHSHHLLRADLTRPCITLLARAQHKSHSCCWTEARASMSRGTGALERQLREHASSRSHLTSQVAYTVRKRHQAQKHSRRSPVATEGSK